MFRRDLMSPGFDTESQPMRFKEVERLDFEEDQDLFEMANLYPRTTGLPRTVWVSPKGRARHDVRVKVSTSPGDRMDAENTAIVGVRPRPALLHGELSPEHLVAILSWVGLNSSALVEYWDGAIDTVELVARLQKV